MSPELILIRNVIGIGEFNPEIYYSFKFNFNLKNVNPKEKISHFSASNIPISIPLLNFTNSGDI